MGVMEKTIQWIYTLLFSVLMIVVIIMAIGFQEPIQLVAQVLADPNLRWMLGIGSGTLLLLGFYSLFGTTKARPIQQTVIKTTQLGEVSISLEAVEELVSKAAGKVAGVREIKPTIKATEQGVAILIKGRINGEEHIPQVSVQIQDTVRDMVETIIGVSVVEVRVHIEGVAKEVRTRVE